MIAKAGVQASATFEKRKIAAPEYRRIGGSNRLARSRIVCLHVKHRLDGEFLAVGDSAHGRRPRRN